METRRQHYGFRPPTSDVPAKYRLGVHAVVLRTNRRGIEYLCSMDPAIRDKVIQEARNDPNAGGLAVGAAAPDFALRNAVGDTVRLSDSLRRGPVILKFYRGAWCPICNRDLHGYHLAMDRIENAGASLLAITPQNPDKSAELAEVAKLRYQVLSDPSQQVIRAYRLQFRVPDVYLEYRDISLENGDGSVTLPVPATYVIDTDGTVAGRHVDPDYRNRMGVEEALAIIAGL